MITNFGKNILAKYLVGQAPAYASFIAIGSGSRPIFTGLPFDDYSTKEQLDFETLRIPITSSGFVYDENDKPNICFLAEIPTNQRYGITEVGIFPALSNPSAGSLDSRIIYTFGEEENWEYHDEDTASSIRTELAPLNLDEPSGRIAVIDTAFRTSPSNTLFASPIRTSMLEIPRFLDRCLIVKGDMSFLESINQNLSIVQDSENYFGSHLHYNGISLNFDRNSGEDEIRLAFSVLSKDEVQSQTVQSVKILVEFSDSDLPIPESFARMQIDLNQTDPNVNFSLNRYFVAKQKLGEMVKSPNFAWSSVNTVKIYVSVFETGVSTPSDNFYVAFDGLRFENTTIKNSLYGLAGYSVIKTLDGKPVIKESNTSNMIEFRFGLDVQ